MTDISTTTKMDATHTHLTLLCYLQRNPENVIAYMDGSQLATATGAGFTILTGLPTAITAVIPLHDTAEVFDAELYVIHECLLKCLKYVRLHHLHHQHIHIFTDNQAAISRSSGLHRGSRQEMAYILQTAKTMLLGALIATAGLWIVAMTASMGYVTFKTQDGFIVVSYVISHSI
jgi:hypothetical protein